MRYHHSRAGFTVVEVLLAISILATLSALMWASISQMYKTRDMLEERAARYQTVRITMDRMTAELASAYIAGPEFGGEPLPGEEFADEANGEDDMMVREEPLQYGLIGRDDTINFTTMAHMRTFEGERASHHAEIGYFIRSERDDEGRLIKKLMRRSDTSVDDDITRGGVVYTMFEDIEEVEFEYWDPGDVELGTLEEVAQGRWVDSWDTTRREYAGRLPTRVRITLVLPPQGPSKNDERFTTQTHIQTTEVLEF